MVTACPPRVIQYVFSMGASRAQARSGGWFFRPSGLFSKIIPQARIAGLVCAGLGFYLVGCQTAGPHLHSQADRVAYANLSSEDRLFVDSGRLQAGMAPETVQLSWGKPKTKRAFVDQGKERIEWLYYGMHWVDQPTWEYVYLDRYGQPYLDFHMNRVGIPFVRAKAVFEDSRLVDWQLASY